jgi:large subunit ribosomal protein L25
MEQLELKAQARTLFGKKTKRLRKEGLIPAILYGPRTDAVPLQLPERELSSVLDQAGTNRLINLLVDEGQKPRMIQARDVQRDVITQSLIHVDLYEVVMTEKITADVPITLVGEAPGVLKKQGLLVRGVDSVQIHCLPDRLIHEIEVDISVLVERDQAILVEDLVVGGDIEILTNPEEVVAQILTVREPVIEAEVEEEVEVVEGEAVVAAEEGGELREGVAEEAAPPEHREQGSETE